jgi:hypothetical protein
LAPITAAPSQPATAASRTPDVAAATRRADVAADAVNQPVADQSTVERLEKPAENTPAAAAPHASNPPLAPAPPVRLPGISYLLGVARGPLIQAPKGLRPLTGQPRAVDRNAGSINASQIQAESPNPTVVEHAVAQVRENQPAGTLAHQPDLVAPAYAGRTEDVTPNTAEPGISQSNRSQPPNPSAPREPVRAIPAPVQTPVQPQPAREATARPIAALSRPPNRLNVGRIDVHVKNSPSAARPASQPSPASAGVAPLSALEALGMDRFTMKP